MREHNTVFIYSDNNDIPKVLFLVLRDTIMSIFLKMPREIMLEIANKARDKRLSMNLSQKTMVERSGVKYGTIKKFEQTGVH